MSIPSTHPVQKRIQYTDIYLGCKNLQQPLQQVNQIIIMWNHTGRAEEEEVLAIKALAWNTGGFSKAANSAKDLCS